MARLHTLALAAFLTANCASKRGVSYPFEVSEQGVGFLRGDDLDPAELGPEQRAVLLVPRGVATFAGQNSLNFARPPLLGDGGLLYIVPGRRTLSFSVRTTDDDGERVNPIWTVTHSFERGQAYVLEVGETHANVTWALRSLDAAAYAKCCAHVAVQPELPRVAPIQAPVLPRGVQADGSLVVAGEEQHGIPAIQISAPLYECPAKAAGLAESTLAVDHLAQACGASDPDLILDGSQAAWDFGARVLGADWRLPSVAEAHEIAYLARAVRSERSESHGVLDVLGRIYVLGADQVDAVTIGDVARDRRERVQTELRCVRSPTTMAPVQRAPRRCPPRLNSANGDAGTRPNQVDPR